MSIASLIVFFVVSLLGSAFPAQSAGAAPESDVATSGSRAPGFGWKGAYAGISAGAVGFWSQPVAEAVPSPEVFGLFGPLTGSELRSFTPPLRGSYGASLGAQVGFNQVLGRVLIGAELEGSVVAARDRDSFSSTVQTEISAGTPDDVTVPVTFVYRGQVSHELPWFATARARIGYIATERLAVYATGGVSLGRVRTHHSAELIPAGAGLPDELGMTYSDTLTSTRVGIALGAGVEYFVSESISLRAEYTYNFFGGSSSLIEPDREPDDTIPLPIAASAGAGDDAPFLPGASISVNNKARFHTIRIGISFHF